GQGKRFANPIGFVVEPVLVVEMPLDQRKVFLRPSHAAALDIRPGKKLIVYIVLRQNLRQFWVNQRVSWVDSNQASYERYLVMAARRVPQCALDVGNDFGFVPHPEVADEVGRKYVVGKHPVAFKGNRCKNRKIAQVCFGTFSSYPNCIRQDSDMIAFAQL